MTTGNSAQIRQSELHGRLVIDLETTEELGRLAYLLVDTTLHQLEGFFCRSGLLGRSSVPVPWVEIESVGQDSILVRRGGGAITERFSQALELKQQAIWADTGNHVGQLVDYCIDLETGAVTQYLFTAPGWQGFTEGLYVFLPAAVVSTGQKRMMVRHSALEEASQFVPGVQERLTGVLQQDFQQTQADLRQVAQGTQAAAEKVQEQTQKLGEQARSQVGQLFGQLKQRGKQLRTQVNESFADAAANVQAGRNQPPEEIAGTTIDVDSEAVWPEAEDASAPDSETPQKGE